MAIKKCKIHIKRKRKRREEYTESLVTRPASRVREQGGEICCVPFNSVEMGDIYEVRYLNLYW